MSGSEDAKSGERLPLRVLFYEPAHRGHHLAYLGRMLPGFLELPITVGLAMTAEGVASDEYRRAIKPFEDRLELLPVCKPRPRSQILTAWQRYREAASLARTWHADHVCLVYGDGIWLVAAITDVLGIRLFPKGIPIESWLFRGAFTYPDAARVADGIRRWLFRRAIQRGLFTKVHLDDDLLFEFAKKIPKPRTEIALAPGPILLRDSVSSWEAREQLGLPRGGTIISTSGMITRWKGCDLVLGGFAKLLDDIGCNTRDVHLLLAGPHEAEIKSMLMETPFAALVAAGRIHSVDRYLDENEMLTVAEASDLVLAAYRNHSGRSSIILWAAAAGKPVIGADTGTIDYVIRSEQLGTTCDVQSAEVFAAAIRQALRGPWTDADIRRVQTYARWHRIENYQQLSSAFVRSRC